MQLWCMDKNFHSAVRSHASVHHELLCALNRKDVFFFFFSLLGWRTSELNSVFV